MENVSSALWNASLPFYVEGGRPGTGSHRHVEYTEFEEKEKALKGTVEEDEKKFKVSFGAKQFKPEEIKIRLSEDQLIVEGVQESQGDEGYFSRRFIRQYTLPKNVDVQSFKSRYSKDGILCIEAEKLEQTEPEEKFIKIETEAEGKVKLITIKGILWLARGVIKILIWVFGIGNI